MLSLQSRRIPLLAWNIVVAFQLSWYAVKAFQSHGPIVVRRHQQLCARNSRRSEVPFKKKKNSGHSRVPHYEVDDDDDDFFDYWDDEDESYKDDVIDHDDGYARMEDDDSVPTTPPNSHFFSRKSLSDPSFMADDPNLFHDLCKGVEITRPSKIQSIAWPVLLQGKNAIMAEQTGSGKTLGYLIPLIQRFMTSDESQQRSKKKQYGAPRIIVLTPTSELADQTLAVCDKLQRYVPFSTFVLTATGKYATSIRDQIRILERQPIDVLISTPGRLATILRTRHAQLDLSQLQSIVLDEVDVLLQMDDDSTNNDDATSFGPQLRTLGAAAPVERVQFVFCTATLPDSIVNQIEQEFPAVVKLQGPGLHRVAPTIKERLVDVSVPSKTSTNSRSNINRDLKLCFDIKAKQLLKALRQVRCRRTLVFCNTVESCRQVENLLHRRDRKGQLYQVRSYHNAMTPEARNINLAAFCSPSSSNLDSVLVCTDRASRGVDFDAAPVDHVILFDFPKDPAEYVRRVGRTARAGRTGYSTVFAYGWQLPIARSVMGKNLNKNKNQLVENLAAAADTNDVMSDKGSGSEEYLGGVKGRRRRQGKNGKDNSIRGNIQGGRLWGG